VSEATPAELQALLAGEFENRGWEYDMTVGTDLVGEVERRGEVDPAGLATRVSGTWLTRNGATREQVAAAIERAIGGRTPKPAEPTVTVLNSDNRSYSLHLEAGAQITGSQVNLGGTQINIRADAPKDDVLAGVEAVVRAGLAGNWDRDAARELGAVIGARGDIALADVETAVSQVVEDEPPEPGRARRMLESISTQGLGGALGTGISAVIGALIRNPPI
jgi:hypothetical protein